MEFGQRQHQNPTFCDSQPPSAWEKKRSLSGGGGGGRGGKKEKLLPSDPHMILQTPFIFGAANPGFCGIDSHQNRDPRRREVVQDLLDAREGLPRGFRLAKTGAKGSS